MRRFGSGWEPELRIVVDTLLDPARLLGVLAEFYAEQGDVPGGGTAVRITGEVLTGTWEALSTGRADLAIGVGAAAISGSGLAARPWGGAVRLRGVAAASLARAVEPLPAELIQRHRAVAVGDTARSMPLFSTGLLSGQDVLTVPTMRAKLAAQVAGLGCGFLPDFAARPEVKAGRLVVQDGRGDATAGGVAYAWRAQEPVALRWFLKRLDDPRLRRDFDVGLAGRGASGRREAGADVLDARAVDAEVANAQARSQAHVDARRGGVERELDASSV